MISRRNYLRARPRDERIDGWIGVWMDGWMDGKDGESIKQHALPISIESDFELSFGALETSSKFWSLRAWMVVLVLLVSSAVSSSFHLWLACWLASN